MTPIKNRLFLALLISFFLPAHAFPQAKLIKKLFSNDSDSTRAPSFLPVPVLGYSQESGLEVGAISLYSFYTDRKDTLTRNSSLSGLASITTKKQSSFFLKSDIWTPQNTTHFVGELRYKNFPFNFYGIGNRTAESDEDLITQKFFRFTAAAEKKIGRNSYTGILGGFENYRYIDKETGGIFSTESEIFDKDGGSLLYFGVNQIFDSRNSNTYTTRGLYLNLGISLAPDIFGGNNFKGFMADTELKYFKSLSPTVVIGVNGIYKGVFGEKTPFYLLRQLGNDEMMRGYYSGRFRDENLAAAQSELRWRPHPRLGMVMFAAAGNVYAKKGFRVSELKPSYGGGFRYFFDTARGLSVRLDYGIGEKKMGEQRQKGFYLSLGESF